VHNQIRNTALLPLFKVRHNTTNLKSLYPVASALQVVRCMMLRVTNFKYPDKWIILSSSFDMTVILLW